MPRSSDRRIETPLGPARVVAAVPARARATLVLGHGASGGIEARDLTALAATLSVGRIAVIRVEQPWKVAGRRLAPPPGQIDLAWRAVLDSLDLDGLLSVGGRSAGARVACRTAVVGVAACLSLSVLQHQTEHIENYR